MGLGPKGHSLRERLGIRPIESLSEAELETSIVELQKARSLARTLGNTKKKEAKPKPRRHKNHCPCRQDNKCCRCEGVKCVKPKKIKKSKTRTKI